MIEITEFIKKYMTALDQAFPDRVWFAGLQGSYGRGEATEASDIDMVVILDQLSASDIRTYDAMLDTLPCRELICGFLSGRQELENWEPVGGSGVPALSEGDEKDPGRRIRVRR